MTLMFLHWYSQELFYKSQLEVKQVLIKVNFQSTFFQKNENKEAILKKKNGRNGVLKPTKLIGR